MMQTTTEYAASNFFLLTLCLSNQLVNFAHSLLIILLVSFVYPPGNIIMVLWANALANIY